MLRRNYYVCFEDTAARASMRKLGKTVNRMNRDMMLMNLALLGVFAVLYLQEQELRELKQRQDG